MKGESSSSPVPPADARQRSSRTKPLDWAQASGAVEPVLRSIEQHARRRQQWRVAAGGAAFAMMLLGSLAWRFAVPGQGADTAPVSAAVVLQPGRQVLPDGSTIEFRDDAAVTIHFEPSIRRVVLRRGEAHFEVKKDPARPFVVEASGFGVRAVGTAFSVALGKQTVDVVVTHGRVAVAESATLTPANGSSTAADASPQTLVDAGERLVVDVVARSLPPQALPASEDEMSDRLAWRVPRLEFSGAPLSEVVALFNRHSISGDPVKLVLADPALADLPLSGLLRADNVHVLLRILESSYGLQATHGSGGEILLHRRE